MDTRLLDALRNAPSLDLYELSLAINQMLADPRRILEVRRHLHLGTQVMYFDHRRGTLAPGRVLQLQPTQLTVQDDMTRTHWKLPYAAIVANPAQRAEQASPGRPRPVDVPAFKLGDTAAFTDKHLRERIGTITRMNTKTYSILCDGEQWRVPPGLLRKIIDL
ncbi:hypothetical protein [Collimonas antrihumi]|uniref:hypothetical protein n=1 Tax=Collimonas antrihumi TaxID=1940615 RepID=UPI001B8BB10F|nr:hypothetical protein [Collimonas antrihumi]